MMRILIQSSLFILFFSHFANAQDKPRAEMFGGYSYASIDPFTSINRVNTNGFHGSLAINTSIVDFVSDFSQHFGSLSGENLNVSSVLFGPRFSNHSDNITWFVHSLYGFSRIETGREIVGLGINGRSDRAFTFVPGGGGLDVRVNDKVFIRLFQVDLLFSRWERGDSQMHTRLSSGVVFRLGKM